MSNTTPESTSTDTSIQNKIDSMQGTELVLKCTDGMQLAAKKWSSSTTNNNNNNNNQPKRKILCLHGWLDNAASYHIMAPRLASQLNADIIALDFPGHGHSSHKSADGPPQLLSEYALYVAEALIALNWMNDGTGNGVGSESGDENGNSNGITLIGHSMGAGTAMIFAAAYPECIDRLVLLEGSGPLARKGADASRHLRHAIKRRTMSNKKLYPEFSNDGSSSSSESNNKTNNNSNGNRGKKRYKNLDTAIDARIKTSTLTPGDQYISREAAASLVSRATLRDGVVFNPKHAGGEELYTSTYDGPVYFRHDSRLMWPSFHYYTKEQVDSMLGDVQCPTCLLVAKDGWPEDSDTVKEQLRLLQPTTYERLPGSHHFHADPENAPAVCDTVIQFLTI